MTKEQIVQKIDSTEKEIQKEMKDGKGLNLALIKEYNRLTLMLNELENK